MKLAAATEGEREELAAAAGGRGELVAAAGERGELAEARRGLRVREDLRGFEVGKNPAHWKGGEEEKGS